MIVPIGKTVKAIVSILLLLGALASQCNAEPRWCSITGRDPSNKLTYLPIAVAERVSGVVLSRMIYSTDGKVVRVEAISGPNLLSSSLTGQLMEWTAKTDAVGDELCQTLVIVEFRISDSYYLPPPPLPQPVLPSIQRYSVETELSSANVCFFGPRGWKAMRVKMRYKLKQILGRLF